MGERVSGYSESEIVIGLVGAVGTDLDGVIKILKERLEGFSYETETIHISEKVIREIAKVDSYRESDHAARIKALIKAGDDARENTRENAILAFGAAMAISKGRSRNQDGLPEPKSRRAYILRSLKRPEEVETLRNIYGLGFYLVGVYEEKEKRLNRLISDKHIEESVALKIMDQDENEPTKWGQRTRNTFHLADFFVNAGAQEEHLKNCIQRILDILFGSQYNTPTFDEYAMFMAFSSALRSADLSRQVGAVIAKDNEILSMGANDCPKYGGGLYWAELDAAGHVVDVEGGRDCTRGFDSNKIEKDNIVRDIYDRISRFLGSDSNKELVIEEISKSSIGDITEYGRVVHAEMEAILACARQSVSLRYATLYCTTFPCHNCAKHIIASGIRKVIYVEPYPKSKAFDFHKDSITLGLSTNSASNKVSFEPFVGIGARRFADLFSMSAGSGSRLERKGPDGRTLQFNKVNAKLRVQMAPVSYLENEIHASDIFKQHTIGERS